MPVGLAVGAIGYGVSAGVSSGASKDAAKKQQEAAIYQAKIARDAFKRGSKNLQPYADIGRTQIAPYQQAIGAYEAAMPGYFDQYQNYLNAVGQYGQQGIGGVNAAMADYQSILPNYQAAMDRYGKATDQYQQTFEDYRNAIPRMTREYGMEDYKNSPLYTPMVNNLAELQATPGYQFQLQQGQQALGQSAAARGGLLSGAQQKAAQGFAQKQAATGFQDAWNRAQQAYQTAFSQDMANKQQLGSALSNQSALAATGAGLYGAGVNQAAQQAGLYGDVVNQAMGRAGLYQNAAGMQGQGLGYYGAGMGLLGQNIANRGAALDFGYGATKDIENYRKWANTVAQQSASDYGTAGAQNALTQGNIMGGLAGNLGGMLGGYLGNNFGSVFGSTGSAPTWSGGVANTQNRMGGFADLINSAPRGTYY